jgi:uncharacterized membrane protein
MFRFSLPLFQRLFVRRLMSAVWTINLKANVVLLVMLAIIMVVYFQI